MRTSMYGKSYLVVVVLSLEVTFSQKLRLAEEALLGMLIC